MHSPRAVWAAMYDREHRNFVRKFDERSAHAQVRFLCSLHLFLVRPITLLPLIVAEIIVNCHHHDRHRIMVATVGTAIQNPEKPNGHLNNVANDRELGLCRQLKCQKA